jgi:cytochrome c biogenesis factor
MISILGEIFLYSALITCGIGILRVRPPKNLSLFVFVSMSIAFGLFITAHATDQFELLNVYLHSHTKKPMLYKIAGAWASHEGSLFLWCLLLSGYSALFNRLFVKKYEAPPFQHGAVFLYALQCSFLLFVIIACNPFERLLDIPLEGQDLNPLLQDISLVIHPPHLYLGTLGFAIPFVVSLSILLHGSLTPFLMRVLRLFLLLAQTFLTIGIVLGCAWAYYELGWGGWWFFDPVENLALMPWLFGLIALHMTLITQKTGKYPRPSLLFALLPFLQALMGLACVRSGLLNSVHSFAEDPLRSTILWIIFCLWSCLGLVIYLKRQKYFRETDDQHSPTLSQRTLCIIGAVLFLLIAWGSLFIGTIVPLVLDGISTSIVLDNGFYAWTFVPCLGIALSFLFFTPFASWSPFKKMVLFYHRKNMASSFPHLLTHGGALLSVLGMVLSFFYGIEMNQTMHINTPYTHNNMHIELQQVLYKEGPNYHTIQGVFKIKTDYTHKIVTAEERIFWTQKDAHIKSKKDGARHVEAGLFTYDILSQGLIMFATTDDADVFTVRLIFKPFIHFMWSGFFIIILGLALSTLTRFRKEARLKKHPIL